MITKLYYLHVHLFDDIMLTHERGRHSQVPAAERRR
jgi:hypothetical protein